ncbi:hypothetical protein CEUSTIGMA_g13085.t1 [Chlamydomonas eustigma]|uniref:Uncharacterized protein n=1 Tax=Chlamydomonas eustigma TaxID=1157962 RepID=A0A250XS92_9CHLO|nr:hypothetical protein CEUSTIGMA_g13085.t1 [Chlamydomonas eustigma]|eukprot:GAX85670.1 hypothetical protein CEUSTIGMA_g13085.t1 [Chlamydomonas eustigma]
MPSSSAKISSSRRTGGDCGCNAEADRYGGGFASDIGNLAIPLGLIAAREGVSVWYNRGSKDDKKDKRPKVLKRKSYLVNERRRTVAGGSSAYNESGNASAAFGDAATTVDDNELTHESKGNYGVSDNGLESMDAANKENFYATNHAPTYGGSLSQQQHHQRVASEFRRMASEIGSFLNRDSDSSAAPKPKPPVTTKSVGKVAPARKNIASPKKASTVAAKKKTNAPKKNATTASKKGLATDGYTHIMYAFDGTDGLTKLKLRRVDGLCLSEPKKRRWHGDECIARAHWMPGKMFMRMDIEQCAVLKAGRGRSNVLQTLTIRMPHGSDLETTMSRIDDRVVCVVKENVGVWFQQRMNPELVEEYYRPCTGPRSTAIIAASCDDAGSVLRPGTYNLGLVLVGVQFWPQTFYCVWKIASAERANDEDATDATDATEDDDEGPPAYELSSIRAELQERVDGLRENHAARLRQLESLQSRLIAPGAMGADTIESVIADLEKL